MRDGFDPAQETEWRDLLAALRRAADEELTERQRRVLAAIVLNGVSLDTLVIGLDSNRNAIYKAMFDARRKLRAALVARYLGIAAHLRACGPCGKPFEGCWPRWTTPADGQPVSPFRRDEVRPPASTSANGP